MSGAPRKQCVVLDANALMMPFQFSINIDAEIERLIGRARIVVPECVVRELEGLRGRAAKAALMLARKYEIVPSEGTGDECVLSVALRENAYLLTNDAALRRRARAVGVKCIYLRKSSYLEVW